MLITHNNGTGLIAHLDKETHLLIGYGHTVKSPVTCGNVIGYLSEGKIHLYLIENNTVYPLNVKIGINRTTTDDSPLIKKSNTFQSLYVSQNQDCIMATTVQGNHYRLAPESDPESDTDFTLQSVESANLGDNTPDKATLARIQQGAVDCFTNHTVKQALVDRPPCITLDGSLVLVPITVADTQGKGDTHYDSVLLHHYLGHYTEVSFKQTGHHPLLSVNADIPYISYLSQDGTTIVIGGVVAGMQELYSKQGGTYTLIPGDIYPLLRQHHQAFANKTWVYNKQPVSAVSNGESEH